MLLFILQPDVFFEFCIFTVTVTIQYFREAVYRIVTDSYKTNYIYKGEKSMKLLKDRILKDGVVKPGNILKVDSFLNHQMDITLINEIGKEFKRRFSDCPITKNPYN